MTADSERQEHVQRRRIPGDSVGLIIFSALLVFVASIFFALSRGMSSVNGTVPGAVAVVTVALVIAILVRDLNRLHKTGEWPNVRKESGLPDDTPEGVPADRATWSPRLSLAILLIAGYGVGAYVIGLFAASGIVLAVGALTLGARLRTAIILTVLGGVLFYLFFVELVGVEIQWGLFG